MNHRPSLVERVTRRIRDNPVVAAGIVVGVTVVWLASFSEAVRKLWSALPDARPAAVAGLWQSDALKDARTRIEYRYVFDLKAEGRRVYGSAERRVPWCDSHPDSGLCADHARKVAVVDGTVDAKALAFAIDWGELPGGGPWSWVRVKETFKGSIDGPSIRFVVQDDRNDPPTEVVARMQGSGGTNP